MTIILKYFRYLTSLLLAFFLTISCGANGYRVPIDEDWEQSRKLSKTQSAYAPSFGVHSAEGWTHRPIPCQVGKFLSQYDKDAFLIAVGIWEKAIGGTLIDYQGEDFRSGDSFEDLYSSLDDGVNGIYLDKNWKKTGKKKHTIATTVWINNESGDGIVAADIRLNGETYRFGDSEVREETYSKKIIVDSVSLFLHELGHFIGLSHVDEDADAFSVMNPTMFIGEGMQNRVLSEGDIARIRAIYSGNANQ